MKEINIAKTIINKRKERGITQEELANHMGVTFAAVSKWETSQSYPDISLLPRIAAYFNISIDDLMGYAPQMEDKDIVNLYHRLYADLSKKPFDEVIAECREVIKKYYSCFPLLLNMGDLLINASAINGDDNTFFALTAEAKALFVKVKTESNDMELINMAFYMEATCEMYLGEPSAIIDLLGKTKINIKPHESLLAMAYQQLDRQTESESILQSGIYQHIFSAFDLLVTYIGCIESDDERFDEIVKRTLSLVETFNIDELHQPFIGYYVAIAQGFLEKQNTEMALDMLERFAKLVTNGKSNLPQGDSFFNLIDTWLNEPLIATPKDAINKQLANEIIKDEPIFDVLKDNPRFQTIMKRLESVC